MKKQLFYFFFCTFFLIFLTPTFAQNKKAKWLYGIWAGNGCQIDVTDQTWWMQIRADKDTIRVIYPDLGCAAIWKLQKADDYKAELIEVLTEGTDRCMNNGKVIVTKINEQFVTVSFFYPDVAPGKLSAFTTLERQANDPDLSLHSPRIDGFRLKGIGNNITSNVSAGIQLSVLREEESAFRAIGRFDNVNLFGSFDLAGKVVKASENTLTLQFKGNLQLGNDISGFPPGTLIPFSMTLNLAMNRVTGVYHIEQTKESAHDQFGTLDLYYGK